MQRSDHLTAAAAATVLVICMGFGRFAFTGLYPLMVADHQISVVGGSYAASANYAGYLIGALLAASLGGIPSRRLCAFAVLATAATLGLLWFSLPEWLIATVRGLAGVASAIGMIAAAHWLIQDRQQANAAPTLFAGVGIGILLSAEIIAACHAGALGSGTIWLLLGLVCAALSAVVIIAQQRTDRHIPQPTASGSHVAAAALAMGATRLIVVYGLAGFGYIVTATYLPLLVRGALASLDPVHVWALFGLGAAPSCFLWHRLHERWGTNRSLGANLAVQAVGVVLPVLHVPAAYLASAVLVGGTFIGTVTIVMPAARMLAKKVRFNMLAMVTAGYGMGQILGPLVASALFAKTQSFDASLYCAATALVAGALLAMPRRAQ